MTKGANGWRTNDVECCNVKRKHSQCTGPMQLGCEIPEEQIVKGMRWSSEVILQHGANSDIEGFFGYFKIFSHPFKF